MLTRLDMMDVLLDACPSFAPRLLMFIEAWAGETDPPLYVALRAFSRHLIGMQERGQASELIVVFGAIERLFVEGDGYVKKAMTVGVLENLQSSRLHSRTRPGEFVPYLGAESVRSWHALKRFWSGDAERDPGGV